MADFEDLTGKIFGRLTVLYRIYNDNNSPSPQWLCECSCEKHNKIVVTSGNLKNGGTQSCGCLKRELLAKFNKETKKKAIKYDEPFSEYGIGYCSNTQNPFYFNIEDYEKIKSYTWNEHVKSSGYHILEAWDEQTKRIISMTEIIGCKGYDHINRNTLDNRRSNLRPTTQAENTRNRSRAKNNSSGIVGVGWVKKLQKWRARITFEETPIYLGIFDNKEDAIIARLNAEKKYFGEFAPQIELFEQYGIKKGDE